MKRQKRRSVIAASSLGIMLAVLPAAVAAEAPQVVVAAKAQSEVKKADPVVTRDEKPPAVTREEPQVETDQEVSTVHQDVEQVPEKKSQKKPAVESEKSVAGRESEDVTPGLATDAKDEPAEDSVSEVAVLIGLGEEEVEPLIPDLVTPPTPEPDPVDPVEPPVPDPVDPVVPVEPPTPEPDPVDLVEPPSPGPVEPELPVVPPAPEPVDETPLVEPDPVMPVEEPEWFVEPVVAAGPVEAPQVVSEVQEAPQVASGESLPATGISVVGLGSFAAGLLAVGGLLVTSRHKAGTTRKGK